MKYSIVFRKVLLSFLLCGSLIASGQDILKYKFDGTEEGKQLATVLSEIGKKENAHFYFIPEWIQSVTFLQNYTGQTLGEVLDTFFLGTDLNYVSVYPQVVVIIKDPSQALLRNKAIENAVREKKKIERLVFGEPGSLKKGQQITISGNVIDAKTSEPLAQTSIRVSDTQYGTTTDQLGNYSLTLSPGIHVLSFSFVDYESKVIDLLAYGNGEINLEMDRVPIILEEVVIQSQATQELATSRIGQIQMTVSEFKRTPAFLGETDLIKQVQALPGVTTVGEAATGFNVRGGSVDQNLILYDGLPAFNSSHVFGFLS